jgi:alkylhydroperoxidase family enzyme
LKHLPLISKDDTDPELRRWWDERGFDLAIFHVWAHDPDSFRAYATFNRTVWQETEGGFPLLLKELAVVQASVLSDSSYEWGNHGVQMINRGGTQAQVDALIAGDLEADVFDETEKLVLKFTTEVTLEARPSEETLTAMSQKFSNRQIVQLAFAICAYMLNSRLANLGGCELGDDEDYGMFALGRKT